MRAAVDVDRRLTELAADEPDRPALVVAAEGRTISYRELHHRTERIARELTARAESACVLVDSSDGTDSHLRLIAALRCPRPVALRSRLDRDRTAESLLDAGIPVLDARDGTLRRPSAGSRPLPPHALVLPTGGTSGADRRVVDLRMRTVPAQPRPLRLTSVLGWRPGQVQMAASLPPHASSVAFLIEGLADGNTVVVPGAFRATPFLTLIDEHRIEWVQATPFHLRMMQKADDGGVRLDSLHALVHMSARCPDDLKRYWIDRLGPDRIYETYGSTEGIGVTAVGGREWLRRPGTVGKGFFTKVTIVGANGQPVAPGVRGTVFTSTGRRGAAVYLNGDLGRRPDGHVSVGDEGWLDRDGYLYLAPRPLSRITVAGETFDAEDLESTLCGHPDVADAGVCPVARGADWVRLVALVVARRPVSEAALRQWLRGRVTAAVVPRRIFTVDALPRDGAGKLSRRDLHALGTRLANGRGDTTDG